MKSKRQPDINGWYEIKENPLSKVGVFKYPGATIDYKGEFGLDPDKAYNVLRSKEALSDPDTIDSFKLVPWINDHVMLGDGAGYMAAEEKGVNGVIGEDVFFDDKDQMLKGNVKVFGESLKDDIENGKKELSLGYRCDYIKQSGVLDGQGYDFMQTCIRGNHMASVDEGRMGSEVAVMDGNLLHFTIDSKEFKKMKMTPEEMEAALLELIETVKGLVAAKAVDADPDKDTEDADPDKDTEDADPDKDTEDADPDKDTEDADPDKDTEDADPDKDKKDAEGMDALKKTIKKLTSTVDGLKKNGTKVLMTEISKRNTLAESLSQHIGTFDHADKTLDEVAVYGIEKLELKCDKGSELATLNGFLHNRNPARVGHALDSKTAGQTMDGLDNYLKGPKKE